MNIKKALFVSILMVSGLFFLMYGIARMLILASLYIADVEMRHFDRFTESAGLSPVAAAIFWFVAGIAITVLILKQLKKFEQED